MTDFNTHSDYLYDIAVTGTEVIVTETHGGGTAVFHLTAPVRLYVDGLPATRVTPGPTTRTAGVQDSYGFTLFGGEVCDPWGTRA
jgi:hypothetical protein